MKQRWEYLVIDDAEEVAHRNEFKTHAERVTEYLNELGREGWELVAGLGPRLYFKRPFGEE